MNIDRGTKNKTHKGFVRYTIVSASVSAGVTLLISIVMLLALPFTAKFPVIWPASGLVLASLIGSKKKLFAYSILTHATAMVLARGLVSTDWISATLISGLEITNAIAITLILRNLSVNRYIFTSVRKISVFLTVTVLMTIFTGIFSMFLHPFLWENQVSMEWAIWAFSIVPSFWVFTPLVLSYYRRFERIDMDGTIEKRPYNTDPREIGYAVLISILSILILYNFPFSFTTGFVLIMVAVPMLLFAAVRFHSMAFMIMLTSIGESAIVHTYLFQRGFIHTDPLVLTPLFTAKLIYIIFSGALIIISVLIMHLSEQKGLVYRTRGEFAVNFMDSHLGMFHTNSQGVIERVNKTLSNLLGYEHVLNLHTALELNPDCLFYTADDHASFLRLVSKEFGWVDEPLTLRSQNGTPVEVEVAGRPWMEDRQRVFIEVIVTDLSKVIHLNQRLAATEARLRLATEASGVGVWEMDFQTGHLYLNGVMERWFGTATESLAVDLSDFRELIDPAMHHALDSLADDVTFGRENTFEIELRAMARGLGWRVFNFAGKQMFDQNDKPQNRWIGTAWDITDEYNQRERLSQTNEKLRVESVENRKLRDVIAKNAVRDLVTGLYTRNYLQDLHQAMAPDALMNRSPHNLIMIEIRDGSTLIKAVGFEKAQKVITILGEITRQHFRATDHVGRLNTFILGVITDLDDEDGIRTRLVKVTNDFDSAMMDIIKQTLILRTSVASFPTHGKDWAEMVTWAERTLH